MKMCYHIYQNVFYNKTINIFLHIFLKKKHILYKQSRKNNYYKFKGDTDNEYNE